MSPKKIENINELSFGNLCKILQTSFPKKITQVQTIQRLYELMPVEPYKYEPIDAVSANYLFHGKTNVNAFIKDAALHYLASAASESASVLRAVQENILNNMTSMSKVFFLENLKLMVSKTKYDDLNLKQYLNVSFETDSERTAHFIMKCILWCMVINSQSVSTKKPVALHIKPHDLVDYDPHTLFEEYGVDNSVSIIIKNPAEKLSVQYYSFEDCFDFLYENNAVVTDIECSQNDFIIHASLEYNREYTLKRLNTEGQYIQAREFLQENIQKIPLFYDKMNWHGKNLCDLVLCGLQSRKWTAYAYYHGDQMAALLDYKIRGNGTVELGIQVAQSEDAYTVFEKSLIYMYKIKFYNSRLFVGTYEENVQMRNLFKQTDFVPNLYLDIETGIRTNVIADRIIDDKEKLYSNSVYYYSYSLIENSLAQKAY